jgi:hypothetical protein
MQSVWKYAPGKREGVGKIKQKSGKKAVTHSKTQIE